MTRPMINEMQPVLRPCPFCGGPGKIVKQNFAPLTPPERYGVVCDGPCGTFYDCRLPSAAEAAAGWNTRAEPDPGRLLPHHGSGPATVR
jgi:hypothetical protein